MNSEPKPNPERGRSPRLDPPSPMMALATAWRAVCLSRGVGPFTNRHYGLKWLATLALVGLFGLYSVWRGNDINPPLRRCIAQPEKWRNTDVWVSIAQVTSVDDGGFVVATNDTKIPVRGKADVAVGDLVSVRGLFNDEGGIHLDLLRLRKAPTVFHLRWVVEWGSLAVFALIAMNFLRHFAFRREALEVKER